VLRRCVSSRNIKNRCSIYIYIYIYIYSLKVKGFVFLIDTCRGVYGAGCEALLIL
jgi:hypothetical protein